MQVNIVILFQYYRKKLHSYENPRMYNTKSIKCYQLFCKQNQYLMDYTLDLTPGETTNSAAEQNKLETKLLTIGKQSGFLEKDLKL